MRSLNLDGTIISDDTPPFVIVLFYMETRYKIVPELLLPVFSLLTISRLRN